MDGGSWGRGGPTFWFFKSLDINTIYTSDIQLHILAKAVILTGEKSLKRQNTKEITKEKEKKRQENQKNEVIKGKVKIRTERENMAGKAISSC